MVGSGYVQAVLGKCGEAGQVVQEGQFAPLAVAGGGGVGADGGVEELAAWLVLLDLVQVLIQCPDQRGSGLAGAQPMVQGGPEVGVLGAGRRQPAKALLRVAARGHHRVQRRRERAVPGRPPGCARRG
ncbi:MAG TPA: hypothetical protein VFQ44_20745 [Streptosporangiaceae bacterium]|nr:hypothetical protein [Streptosporangiaceae bacterium]